MGKSFMKIMALMSLVLVLLSNVALSEESADQLQAKAVMSNIYDSYIKIIPYAYSSKSSFGNFKSKKEKEELLKNLNDLSVFFKSAKHADFFQRPGFKPSLEAITNHLDETIMSVEADNFLFAQKRLNVIGALCVTCHSQLPDSVSKNAFRENIKKEKRDRFDSDFSYANYLYLVRRFDDSKTYFEKAIDLALANSSIGSHQEVLFSLRRMLSMTTKIKFDFDKSKILVDKWTKDSRLSVNEQKTIKRWSDSLKNWKGFDSKSINEKTLPQFIEKNLIPLDLKKEIIFSGEEDVTLFISSGVLLNFLVENPNSELAPEILYWLSLIEHRMGQSYFFSLGDLYLKDCIRKYPASPYAKKCYQEYSDSIEAGNTGSSGTDIPVNEKRELMKLKALLKP